MSDGKTWIERLDLALKKLVQTKKQARDEHKRKVFESIDWERLAKEYPDRWHTLRKADGELVVWETRWPRKRKTVWRKRQH
jgi:hypothetical protein